MKILYKILLISLIVILTFSGISYCVKGAINQEIASWHSSFTTSQSTDKRMKNWKSELLNNLKSTFGYEGNTINEMMAMKTKIYIVDDSKKDSYKIRVRRR